MKEKLQYRKISDYYIPNIALPSAPKIGKYGELRNSYLRNHKEPLFTALIMQDKLKEHLEEIDQIMARHANGWKPSRITPISRSAIRLCIFEMKYMDDVPHKVAINEAVELVKKYGAEEDPAFVNGVLGSIMKTL